MASSPNLLEFPSEVLIAISCSVPAPDLANFSRVHSIIHTVVTDEEVWMARARKDYKIVLNKLEGFSPREFYQLVLHKYGKLLGLWKRTNHMFYGGLLRVFYDNHAIVIEMLEAPNDVTEELVRKRMVSIAKPKQEIAVKITNHDKLTRRSLVEIQVASKNAFNLQFCEELWQDLMSTNFPQQQYPNNPLQSRKLLSMLEYKDFYTCERLNPEKSLNCNPIDPGLFKGTYGAHGIELINLSFVSSDEGGMKGVKGIKICGDPNVPASEVSFEIEKDMCTLVKSENGKLDFDTIQFVEYQDDLAMDFCIPQNFDYDDEDRFQTSSIRNLKSCKGYWQCKCQVAHDNFTNPQMIPGYFILFSNDMFAVLFIDLQSFSVFHRIKDL